MKKDADNYTAAMLNGYADIVEQIADSKGILLDEAIGSSNRNVINILRLIVYGTVVWAIGYVIYRRRRSKNAK